MRWLINTLVIIAGMQPAADAFGQSADSMQAVAIKDEIFTNSTAYENLRVLCKQVGPRLSGSSGAAKAVEYTRRMLVAAGADTVYLQPALVTHWERGAKEECYAVSTSGSKKVLNVAALGNTVASPVKGVMAKIMEVRSMAELEKRRDEVKGKIVFFNIPMNPKNVSTFQSYGTDGIGRRRGPASASRYGALAVIVRSLASNPDDHPHTGVTSYNDSFPKIPAVAVSTNDAQWLSKNISAGTVKTIFLKTNCRLYPEKAKSYNVIGEIKGSSHPEEILTVGGHLDSWDLAEGAHDDGAGIVQSIEVIRTVRALNIKPSRTIRAVLFMNEENGGGGADAYFDSAVARKEKLVFALESDAGGFTPRSFSIDASDAAYNKIQSWLPLFKPYGVSEINRGGSGADIAGLKKLGAALSGFQPDSQRYFDVHHARSDVFEAVSKRELELGAINITLLIWLVSEKGL